MSNYYDNKDYDPVDQNIELLARWGLFALGFIILGIFLFHLDYMGAI